MKEPRIEAEIIMASRGSEERLLGSYCAVGVRSQSGTMKTFETGMVVMAAHTWECTEHNYI